MASVGPLRPTTPRTTTPTPKPASRTHAFYEFMVPLVKGYSTEISLEVTSLGVQVHGGMGFIEETGAAQYYRDAKILTIYEGTTAIQANDLVGRKTARDGGQVAKAIAAQIEATEAQLASGRNRDAQAVARAWPAARKAFLDVVDFVCRSAKADPQRRVRRQRALPDAGRQPGGRLADGPRAAGGRGRCCTRDRTRPSCAPRSPPLSSTPTTSWRVPGLRDAIVQGADSVTALPLEAF
jgi:hypothetical protein